MPPETKKVFFPGIGEVEAEVEGGRAFVKEKQVAVIEDQRNAEAGAHTESILKFENQRAREQNMDPEDRYFALSLALINMRQSFPKGPVAADAEQKRAWAYWDANQPAAEAKKKSTTSP